MVENGTELVKTGADALDLTGEESQALEPVNLHNQPPRGTDSMGLKFGNRGLTREIITMPSEVKTSGGWGDFI